MLGIFNRNDVVIDMEWIAKHEEDYRHTPDIWRLEGRAGWLLFVYGEEMHTLPIEGICQGKAYTVESFTLWKKRLAEASWAFALDRQVANFSWAEDLQIVGQLYVVPPRMIVALDNWYGNTVNYQRRRMRVRTPFRRTFWTNTLGILKDEFDIEENTAWMYIGTPSVFLPQLKQTFSTPVSQHPRHEFDLVKQFKPRPQSYIKQNYYYFSVLEYEPINPIPPAVSDVPFE